MAPARRPRTRPRPPRRSSRAPRPAPRGSWSRSQRLGTSIAASSATSSTHRKPDEVADRAERRQALLDDGQQRPQLVVRGHPCRSGRRPAPPRRTVATGRSRSSGASRRIHWPLSHSRRSRSNTAPPLWTRPMLEAFDDLVERQDLLLGPGRPAEQGEVVDERLADEPLGDVVADRGLALALAHLGPVRVEDERQVGEPRRLVAERPEQQDVLGRVRQVVLAADDVGDLHRGVVDDDREVVQRRPVGADDDEVATEVADIDLDAAADDVVEGDDALADPEAQRPTPALRLARAALLWRQRRAATDVARWLLGRLLGLAVGVELLGRAEARIGEVVGEQPLGRGGIRRQALHLPIRSVRPACRLAGDLRSLVPGQAQPVQPVEDVLLELDRAARDVRVLEAQDERAADVPGVEVVEQRGPRGPDVERAGRARGDPDAVDGHESRADGCPPTTGWPRRGPGGRAPDRRHP